MSRRVITTVLAVMMAASCITFVAPAPAEAGPKSKERAWKIGTFLGGASTIYALSRGKGTWALIGGGATLLSYSQWRKEVRRRHKRQDLASYRAYRMRWLQRNKGRRIVRR